MLLYTSGTTGRPNGAVLTHENLRANALMVVDLFRITEQDVFFAGAPSMYVALLAAAGDRAMSFPALRAVVSGGGAALPVEMLRRFEEAFGTRVYEGDGLSETSPVVCFNRLDGPRKPGSIGSPVPGAELRLLDDEGRDVPVGEVGELAASGRCVMAGYWRNPEATAEAVRGGWFRTGDLARVDEDGSRYIVDRKKDMILRGGYNVYPREIEEVLYEHPAVAEVAVVGIPDEAQGQEVAAFVVLTEEAAADGERLVPGLRLWVRERVASYKRPRAYTVVDALPKGPTGKILKREVERLARSS